MIREKLIAKFEANMRKLHFKIHCDSDGHFWLYRRYFFVYLPVYCSATPENCKRRAQQICYRERFSYERFSL